VTYQVAVYITNALYDYGQDNYEDGYRARDRAAEYIKEAIDYYDTEDVRSMSEIINAPREYTNRSFEEECLCSSRYNCEYSSLVDWWQTYVDKQCEDLFQAEHSTLLLTSTSESDGGVAMGRFSTAQTGQGICDLPSPAERYGFDNSHDCMHTVLEEVGHSLMSGTNDSDGDGITEHDVGAIYEESEGDCITPMGVNNSENEAGENDCENYQDGDPTGWRLIWSPCCERNWISSL